MTNLNKSQTETVPSASPLVFSQYRRLSISSSSIDELFEQGIKLQGASIPNYTGAIEYYNKILTLNPDHIGALINRGLSRVSQGHPEQALLDFNRVLGIEPNNIMALNNRGSIYYTLGDFIKATSDYNRVLEIEPNNTDATYNLKLIDGELNKGCCVIL